MKTSEKVLMVKNEIKLRAGGEFYRNLNVIKLVEQSEQYTKLWERKKRVTGREEEWWHSYERGESLYRGDTPHLHRVTFNIKSPLPRRHRGGWVASASRRQRVPAPRPDATTSATNTGTLSSGFSFLLLKRSWFQQADDMSIGFQDGWHSAVVSSLSNSQVRPLLHLSATIQVPIVV